MSVAQPGTQMVGVEERDDVAYVTLNRPPLNVLTIAMMRELSGVIESVGQKPSLRAVVIRAEGKAFSVGVDIGEHQGDTLQPLLDTFHTLILKVQHSPVPVIARVHGFAFGGGCELLTAADMVVIAEDAQIGVPEIRLGVFPPAAAVVFPRLIGLHRAMEMILTGEPITGAEAARIGLANRAVPAAQLDEAVEGILGRLRSFSGASLRLARQAVIDSLDQPVKIAMEKLEHFQIERLIPSHDAQEGLRAFVEKRSPVWEHR